MLPPLTPTLSPFAPGTLSSRAAARGQTGRGR